MADIAVFGEPHILLGLIVCARIQLLDGGERSALGQRIQKACRERLERYKMPFKVTATQDSLTTERFKTDRKRGEA